MKKTIRICVADPAGNITIFVYDRFPREQYQQVATQLLAHRELAAEQVAFVEDSVTMCMCGMEFCGNAFRAFAYWKALCSRPPLREVKGKMSGCEGVLTAVIDAGGRDAAVCMPLPESVSRFAAEGAGEGILVDLGGIAHLVLPDTEPSGELFEAIRKQFSRFPAFGVMFLDTKSGFMTPVVYVRDTGTTYFEGSCASGTTAAAVVQAMEQPDGVYRYSFPQPAGTLTAEVTKESGEVREIRLSGLVEVSGVIETEL